MKRQAIDLTDPLNQNVEQGHSADFPITLRPLFYADRGFYEAVPKRYAVVREDTRLPIAVVSDRYTLIPHQRILDVVQQAIEPLDVGPVPRGVYVDRQGARMRALFKFPALVRPVHQGDDICPCLKIQNTYDGTSRITVHIGAFRFVCTNLAVGGGGVFAGGFMSVHSGDIPMDQVAEQLSSYLSGFEAITALYRVWSEITLEPIKLTGMLGRIPQRHAEKLWEGIAKTRTVYEAYNAATHYATHQMRSYRTAFDLLERINTGFQKAFPVSGN